MEYGIAWSRTLWLNRQRVKVSARTPTVLSDDSRVVLVSSEQILGHGVTLGQGRPLLCCLKHKAIPVTGRGSL
jgi:hypothetical protein